MAESLVHTDQTQRFTGAAVTMRLFAQMPLEVQSVHAGSVAWQRAKQMDVADLQAWARTLPSPEARETAFAGAAAGFYERDAALVAPLLRELKGGERDAALHGLAGAMAYQAPLEAASHALAIQQMALRRAAVGQVLSSWMARDAASAREWLTSASSIPTDWKQDWQKR
jgi:hypothetical protein